MPNTNQCSCKIVTLKLFPFFIPVCFHCCTCVHRDQSPVDSNCIVLCWYCSLAVYIYVPLYHCPTYLRTVNVVMYIIYVLKINWTTDLFNVGKEKNTKYLERCTRILQFPHEDH